MKDEKTIKVSAKTKEKLKEYKDIFDLHSMDEVINHLLVNAKIHYVKTIGVHGLGIVEKKTFEIKVGDNEK